MGDTIDIETGGILIGVVEEGELDGDAVGNAAGVRNWAGAKAETAAESTQRRRAIALNGKCLRDKSEEDHDLGYELLKRFARVIQERLQATRLQLTNLFAAG